MQKLLFRNSVVPSINANCTNPDYENSAILEFRSAKRSIVDDNAITDEIETDTSDVLMHLVERTNLSDYKNNILMSPDLQNLNLKKMLNMTLHQFSQKIWQILPAHPSSDESHELELIKCIGQKYLNLRLKSYGKSLTLKHVGDKATLRQKLRKTVLFSNV
ncbi:hypothetical protein ACJJTC_016531 [Scirpophaga incertulas]